MKPTDPNQLEGRALDAAIAVEVMESRTAISCTTGAVNEWVPRFSCDWLAMQMVMEKMRANGFYFHAFGYCYSGIYDVSFVKLGVTTGRYASLSFAEAVCRAALAAVRGGANA